MSTKFYRGTHADGRQSALHDTDTPEAFFNELNETAPLFFGGWTVDVLDYKGDLVEADIDYASIPLRTDVGSLFGVPTRVRGVC